MIRNRFAGWGSELEDRDFGIALAALGVIGNRLHREDTSRRDREYLPLLERAILFNDVVPWRLSVRPEHVTDYIAPIDATTLKNAWEKVSKKRSKHCDDRKLFWRVRLELQMNKNVEPILPGIIEQLMYADLGSIYVRQELTKTSTSWNWPVQVRIVSDSNVHEIVQSLKDKGWIDSLTKIQELEAGKANCDLLVIPMRLRKALGYLSSLPYPVRASFVAVLGGVDEPWNITFPFVKALQAKAHAGGIFITLQSFRNYQLWFTAFIELLSHNSPLDIALTKSCERPQVFINESKRVFPLPFISRQLIKNSRLCNIVNQMVNSLKRTPSKTRITVPEHLRVNLQPDMPSIDGSMVITALELARQLRSQSEKFEYIHETAEATDIAKLKKAMSMTLAKLPEKAAPRWIQSQIFEQSPDMAQPVRASRALRADTHHILVVRIGPADLEWLTPPEKATFPDYKLNWKKDRHELQVIFSEPNHAPEPQVSSIILPRMGPSTSCQFHFHTRSDVSYFNGRVIVVHRNRVLQTALLQGQVVKNPSIEPYDQLNWTIESVIKPNLNNLGERQDFDLALVANHTIEGESTITSIANKKATFRSLKNVEDVIEKISALLKRPVIAPEVFSNDLNADENVEWLRLLAIYGSSLYEGIVTDQIGKERLKTGDNRIQLVSARDEYLPIEFLYDLPPPKETAPLCPNAIEALEEGKCSDCQNLKSVPADFVCPFGFWCLRMVIERHHIDPLNRPDLKGDDFALQTEPVEGRQTLMVLKSAVYGASSRVDNAVPGQREMLFNVIKDVTNQNAVSVETWDDWVKAVGTNHPSLLVLLPHTLRGGPLNLDMLEIGENSELGQPYISTQHIRPSLNYTPPVAFLIGCETLAPDIPFQSFVAQFRRKGAAIVLSTLTPILGRQAAPVAEQLIRDLKKVAEQGKSLGYALIDVRRKALASGIPMALSLVAYGDADWRLKTTEVN